MGKKSRAKRERRTDPRRNMAAAQAERRNFPVFWIVIAVMVAVGIATLVLTAPDDAKKARDTAANKVPPYATVTVEGEKLSKWSGSGNDRAEGSIVPELGGEKFDGFRTTLTPGDGTAHVYVVLAHWCPHCQAEVPRIVDWAKTHELPENVKVVAISTAVDKGQPNFPPAAWLADEQWPYDVLIDDELGSAAEALGIEGFPFLVFADTDGKVTHRFSGEMPIGDFDKEARALAPKPAAAAGTAS